MNRPLLEKATIVYHELNKVSSPTAERFREYFLGTMYNVTSDNEIVLLNRFWRLQLSRLPTSTIDERECLTDEPNFQVWLHNFRRIIIPTIIANNLPVPEM